MSTEERLKIYDLVNSCETFLELANVIRSLADENGKIQGRNRKFDAETMADVCENFTKHPFPPNILTRQFGIRQQAMYIKYYTR